MKVVSRVLLALTVLMLATPALAHVPSFPQDNTSPDHAVVVPDPLKSWSFYDTLAPGQTKYYRLTLQPGDRLNIGTFTPHRGPFTPSVVVMSPSFDRPARVPHGVVVPDGMGAIIVPGTRPATPGYEPFAPGANYETTSFTRRVKTESTYLIAVYEPANRSGPVGVVVGYEESFSPVEYVAVPFDLVRTHLWEGQAPLVVFGPLLATVLGGLGLIRSRRRDDWASPVARYLVGGAGLLIFASGVNTAVQMGLALVRTGPVPGAIVTSAFVVVPLLAGGWTVRHAAREDAAFMRLPRTRLGLAIAGGAAVFTWAGFVLAPLFLVTIAVVPRRLLA